MSLQVSQNFQINKKNSNLISKKSKRINKKIQFFTSRTGKLLDQRRGKNIRKFRKIKFLEDDNLILKDKRGLITQTIEQKNDNDIDSEKEIVHLGVKYLCKKLFQAIKNEKEKKKINERMQTRKIFKEKQKQMKIQQKKNIFSRNCQIPDFFTKNSCRTFLTPNDRKISNNNASYISSIIQQNRKLSGNRLMSVWDSRKLSIKTTVRTKGQITLENKSENFQSINMKINDFLKKSLSSNINEDNIPKIFNH